MTQYRVAHYLQAWSLIVHLSSLYGVLWWDSPAVTLILRQIDFGSGSWILGVSCWTALAVKAEEKTDPYFRHGPRSEYMRFSG